MVRPLEAVLVECCQRRLLAVSAQLDPRLGDHAGGRDFVGFRGVLGLDDPEDTICGNLDAEASKMEHHAPEGRIRKVSFLVEVERHRGVLEVIQLDEAFASVDREGEAVADTLIVETDQQTALATVALERVGLGPEQEQELAEDDSLDPGVPEDFLVVLDRLVQLCATLKISIANEDCLDHTPADLDEVTELSLGAGQLVTHLGVTLGKRVLGTALAGADRRVGLVQAKLVELGNQAREALQDLLGAGRDGDLQGLSVVGGLIDLGLSHGSATSVDRERSPSAF